MAGSDLSRHPVVRVLLCQNTPLQFFASCRSGWPQSIARWQDDALTNLGHRQVKLIFMHILSFESDRIGFPETSAQEKFIQNAMHRIWRALHPVHLQRDWPSCARTRPRSLRTLRFPTLVTGQQKTRTAPPSQRASRSPCGLRWMC